MAEQKGTAYYPERTVDRIKMIRKLQRQGLSLEDIKERLASEKQERLKQNLRRGSMKFIPKDEAKNTRLFKALGLRHKSQLYMTFRTSGESCVRILVFQKGYVLYLKVLEFDEQKIPGHIEILEKQKIRITPNKRYPLLEIMSKVDWEF